MSVSVYVCMHLYSTCSVYMALTVSPALLLEQNALICNVYFPRRRIGRVKPTNNKRKAISPCVAFSTFSRVCLVFVSVSHYGKEDWFWMQNMQCDSCMLLPKCVTLF